MFTNNNAHRLLLLSLLFILFFAPSCTKIGLISQGEKINRELEGDWEIEEYFLNDIDASLLLEDTYLTFAPSVNSPLKGQFITNRKNLESTSQEYFLNKEGDKITIEDSESDLNLEGDLLTIEQTVVEDGVAIKAILVLDKQ